MRLQRKITPCLWFDDEAEDAANFYVGIFDDSRIVNISRYSEEGFEIHQRPAGSVMTVDFELNGQPFTALNGGPVFEFNEAISLQVICDSSEELDYFWSKLSEGGDPNAQQCGWLKDRFGVSWQVYPHELQRMIDDPDSERARRAMRAMLQMKKIDLEELRRAYEGEVTA